MSLGDSSYPTGHVEEEGYFISMTDMMVGLLFIFIILMMYYAMQFRQTTDQLTSADRTRSAILYQLKDYLTQHGVQVEIDTRTGVLRLPDEILFDSGQSKLKPDGVKALGHLADGLMLILPCYADGVPRPAKCPPLSHKVESVFIEGHTDSDPITGHVGMLDNWDLSVARATNTYRQLTTMRGELVNLCLTDRGGPCDPILSVSGYGDKRPVAIGDDDASKRKNRRIDVRILMAAPRAEEAVPIEARLSDQK
jgi:chemotaxis protein MotB